MTDEEVMLAVRVPDELKSLVDADSRSNQEVVRSALWREFGGERKSSIARRIEEKQRRISIIQQEKKEREAEIEKERQELQALRGKRDEFDDQDAARHDACVAFLDAMERANKYVFADHEDVVELARNHFDGDREEAITELKRLNESEGYGFEEVRFGE